MLNKYTTKTITLRLIGGGEKAVPRCQYTDERFGAQCDRAEGHDSTFIRGGAPGGHTLRWGDDPEPEGAQG